MKHKVDTNLAIFISNLREKKEDDFLKHVFIEKRRIYGDSKCSVQNVQKLIYFLIKNIEVDTINFIKASASEDIETKRAGYLGLSICNQSNMLILTVNTIMKDLKDARYRKIAINFLCNCQISEPIYEDLSNYICISKNMDKNSGKSIIAKNKLTKINSFNLVGCSTFLLYIKIQVILDKLYKKEEINLTDNEILYLISIYPTTENLFLKVKLIQIYTFLFLSKKLQTPHKFFNELEKDIISASEKVMQPIKIGLSSEISNFFMISGKHSQKVEYFVFRLISSENPNSRQIGFNLSVKHKFLCEKTIDRAIKIGINVFYCYDALFNLINKNTYKNIYKRIEEIKYVLNKNSVENDKAEKLLFCILSRLLDFSNDQFYLKIFYENPQLCDEIRIQRQLSDQFKDVYFNKLLMKNDVKYLNLFYELIPENIKDKVLLKELFTKHLSLICNKIFRNREKVLNKFLLYFYNEEQLEVYRDQLVEMYITEHKKNYTSSILSTLHNGIVFMNTKCESKILKISDDIFCVYQIVDNNLKFTLPSFVQISKIVTNGEALKFKHEKNDTFTVQILDYNELEIFLATRAWFFKKTVFLKT